TRTDEGTRWIVFAEIAFVYLVELVIEREVGTEHLDRDEVVHGHVGLGEYGFHAVERDVHFLLDRLGWLAGLRIDTNPPGDVKRIADQHCVAERRHHRFGQIDITPGLRGRRLCGRETADDNQQAEHDQNFFHEEFSVTPDVCAAL